MKLDRSAFIYLDPRGEKQIQFAQCSTCMMFTGNKASTCTILKPKEVDPGGSCALYVPGPPHTEAKGKEMATTMSESAITHQEAGYVKTQVRCENCKYLTRNKCMLFIKLNKTMPSIWGLDEKVDPKGCCNAFAKPQKGLFL